MSHVSSLLNPVNPSDSPPPTQPPPQSFAMPPQSPTSTRPQPLVMSSDSPTHRRRESITSPGLDALATAASHSAPLVSPPHQYRKPPYVTQANGNVGLVDVRRQEQQIYASGLEQLSEAAAGVRVEGWERQHAAVMSPVDSYSKAETNGVSEVATTQNRQPVYGPDQNLASVAVPETQHEQIAVKTEVGDTAMSIAPTPLVEEMNGTLVAPDTKPEPASAIPGEIKSEDASKPPPKPKKPPPKKRPPPKKGTAVKPAPKKRKLDSNESADVSPVRAPSVTSRTSATPGSRGRKQESITPSRSSSVARPDEDEASGSDNEVYCICRKPDDHRVMVGCEACDDWFHLNCVTMTEAKLKLVHKWYCPSCTEQGHETLWKRICRLPGCGNPARTEQNEPSKYCSDEHGEEFFRRLLPNNLGVPATGSGWGLSDFVKPPASSNTRRKTQNSMQQEEAFAQTNGNVGVQEEETETRGGVLKVSELKALLDSVNDVSEFHRLGEGDHGDHASYDDLDRSKFSLEEIDQLASIAEQKAALQGTEQMLSDREKFVDMVEKQHKSVWAQMKERGETGKEICGYDARLTWCEADFEAWRRSEEGKAILSSSILSPPPIPSTATVDSAVYGTDEDEEKMVNGVDSSKDEEKLNEIRPGVCKIGFPKKRCLRHANWLRREQGDNAFEKNRARVEIRKLEADDKEIRDRARVRMVEAEDVDVKMNGVHESGDITMNGTS